MTAATMDGASVTYEPKLFSLSGRLGRLRYFMYGTLLSLLSIAVLVPVLATMLLNPQRLSGFQVVIICLDYLFLLVGSLVLARRRLNDLNKTGWFVGLFIVPFVNVGVTFWLLFTPGTAGANSFGPPPVPNSPRLIKAACALVGLFIGLFAFALIAPLSRIQ